MQREAPQTVDLALEEGPTHTEFPLIHNQPCFNSLMWVPAHHSEDLKVSPHQCAQFNSPEHHRHTQDGAIFILAPRGGGAPCFVLL